MLQPLGWYFTVSPPAGDGPMFNVGPWPNTVLGHAQCNDTLGSALQSHPFACHQTGPNPPANCRNLGNGFAYPANYPYPPTVPIVSNQGCVLLPRNKATDLPQGLYALVYTPNGSYAAKKGDGRYEAAEKRAKSDPRWAVGYYANSKNDPPLWGVCPDAPFFEVGGDDACN